MPGLWDSSAFAASAFIDFGRAARGLELIRMMREQGADVWNRNTLDHLEAKALLRMGRRDEARFFIDRIAASQADDAQTMLDDLAATRPE